MRIHLIHGFNVWDGGLNTVSRLAPYLELGGNQVLHHDYGWVGLLRLRWRNQRATRAILPTVQDGDVLVGHSNGCLVAWELIEAGAKPGAVICVQPALRRDTPWPDDLPVLCLYNDRDWIVMLGRAWGRFISVTNPFAERHGWGAAGRYGFDQPGIINLDTRLGPCPADGHSGVFELPPLQYWGLIMHDWLYRHAEVPCASPCPRAPGNTPRTPST